MALLLRAVDGQRELRRHLPTVALAVDVHLGTGRTRVWSLGQPLVGSSTRFDNGMVGS